MRRSSVVRGTLSTFVLLALALIQTGPLGAGRHAVAETRFLQIGTGGVNGTYYPVGTIIANAVSHPPGSRSCEDGGSCGVPNLVALAQTSNGSVENVRAIAGGRLDTGFAQADVAWDAYHGTGAFAGEAPRDDLRVLASLYPEQLHLVVRSSSGIKSVADLKGRRVSLDEPGSGTLIFARLVLAAHGLTDADVVADYVKVGPAASKMRRGEIDALFIAAGVPTRVVTELTDLEVATLVPIDGLSVRQLVEQHQFFSRSRIGADIYKGTGSTPTIAVGAQWLVSAKMPEDLAYGLCKALWSDGTRSLLDAGHEQGRNIRLDTALDGVGIPLHPGAERCYRELSLLE